MKVSVVPPTVATWVPSRTIAYEVIPRLSAEAFHCTVTWRGAVTVAVTPVGTDGGVASGVVTTTSSKTRSYFRFLSVPPNWIAVIRPEPRFWVLDRAATLVPSSQTSTCPALPMAAWSWRRCQTLAVGAVALETDPPVIALRVKRRRVFASASVTSGPDAVRSTRTLASVEIDMILNQASTVTSFVEAGSARWAYAAANPVLVARAPYVPEWRSVVRTVTPCVGDHPLSVPDSKPSVNTVTGRPHAAGGVTTTLEATATTATRMQKLRSRLGSVRIRQTSPFPHLSCGPPNRGSKALGCSKAIPPSRPGQRGRENRSTKKERSADERSDAAVPASSSGVAGLAGR